MVDRLIQHAVSLMPAMINGFASMAGAIRPDDKARFSAKAIECLLRFGPWVGEAAGLGNTKDRRDALRKVTDHAMSDKLSVDVDHPLYGVRPITGAATVRNKLTQGNLAFVALGLMRADAVATWSGRSGDEFNGIFDRHLSELRNDVSAVTDKVLVPLAKDLGDCSKLTWNSTLTIGIDEDGAPTFFKWEPSTASASFATVSTKGTTMTDASATIVSNPAVNAAIVSNKFGALDAAVAGLIDSSLKQLGLPAVREIGEAFQELSAKVSKGVDGLVIKIGEAMEYKAEAGGTLPNGKCVAKKAADVFGLKGAAASPFNLDIPVYEWDAPHPYVPVVNPGYQFQPQQLLSILVAIVTNQRTWLYGDTGCGKTTAIEQVAARMNYPVIRVNFDSEITRMDLIGSKDIIVSGGHPVTTFTEGVLPRAMQMPCIFLADELDFIRADVAYVFQRALEGNGLTLPEDSGRIVMPHPGFRMFATANTQGQGDETGRYQGAKPQSAAFLDRFTMWIGCQYPTDNQVGEMLMAEHPKLPAKVKDSLVKYAREHWTAFANGQVLTALSPRGLLSCAMTYTVYASTIDDKKALAQAMTSTFVDRASREDAQTIKGLISRVVS